MILGTIKMFDSTMSLLRQFNEVDCEEGLTIDFRNQDFIHPKYLVIVAQFVKGLGTGVPIDCVNYHEDSADYVSRMNFFDEIGYEYPELFTRHDGSGRFIPITNINESNRYSLSGEIARIIKEQWSGVDNSLIACLDWSMTEMIDNIFSHSNSNIEGMICAQYFPTKGNIDLTLIDSGIGIPNRLKQSDNYKELSNKELLKISVDKKVTVGTGRGAGLYYTRRIIEENSGRLFINSDNVQMLVNENRKRISFKPKWQGTIIQMRINTNNIIEPENIWGKNTPASVVDFLEEEKLW